MCIFSYLKNIKKNEGKALSMRVDGGAESAFLAQMDGWRCAEVWHHLDGQ